MKLCNIMYIQAHKHLLCENLLADTISAHQATCQLCLHQSAATIKKQGIVVSYMISSAALNTIICFHSAGGVKDTGRTGSTVWHRN